jgi:hypothetical protein
MPATNFLTTQLQVAVKFIEFFNKLTRMISELGDYSETFAQYADVAGNIAHVRNVEYLSIARQFCL